jgi:hypothetical protein
MITDEDRFNTRIVEQAKEITRLNETIAWYQEQVAKMMGAEAKANAPALALLGDERIAERRTGEKLAELLAQYRNGDRGLPTYAEWREFAAPAAPSEQARPTVKQLAAQLDDDKPWSRAEQDAFAVFLSRFLNESSQGIISLGDAWKAGRAFEAAAAPAAPLPDQPEQSALVEKLMADMDTLRDDYASLSNALAFWLPNVPEQDGPIQDRIVHDVFFLGADGEPKSAQDLGWITLNVGQDAGSALLPAQPTSIQLSDSEIYKRIAEVLLNNTKMRGATIGLVGNQLLPLFKALAGAAPLPELTGPSAPTGLSKRLRDASCNPGCTHERMTLFMQAADEIERYYGGMLAWKKTAESKDAALSATWPYVKDIESVASVFDAASPSPAPAPTEPISRDIAYQALSALGHAMTICDGVPTKVHLSDDSALKYLGLMVNYQEGTGHHGYRMIQDALAALGAELARTDPDRAATSPTSRMGGITSKESAETAAPGASTEGEQ